MLCLAERLPPGERPADAAPFAGALTSGVLPAALCLDSSCAAPFLPKSSPMVLAKSDIGRPMFFRLGNVLLVSLTPGLFFRYPALSSLPNPGAAPGILLS